MTVQTAATGPHHGEAPRAGRRRRVLFAAIGSLGDLHPLFAVGNGLLARGHAVALATSAEHRERVEAAGLEWRHMRPDMPAGEEPAALFAKVFDPRTGPEFTFRRVVAPAVRDSHADLSEASRDADLLVSTTAAFAAPLVAARRPGLAWASAAFQPLSFFSASDPPVLSQAPRLTAALHGLGPLLGLPMRAIGRATTRPWSAPIRALRRELGLPTPGPDPLWEGQHAPALVLAMFSPLLAPPQPDWPPQARVTGYPFWDRADAGRPAPEGLDAFLAAGPPPVVFTLGSAVVMAARSFYAESLAAARALGRRALLLAGPDPAVRASLPDPLPEGALAVDYAPHAAVFPRAAAVVHQGGAGTLAQALRAGRPMLVAPFGHDQPDNAARARRLGVARILPPARYSAAAAARELGALLADPVAAARAEEVGRAVRAEDGAGAACDAIEDLLASARPG